MNHDLFRKKEVSRILQDVERGDTGEHLSLKKHLGVRDLTSLGIAAIIGAGIFSTIGNASASGGPGVIFLFLFTAIACSFAAFAYAEFASLVPVSGSAYTYSYVAFGELIAWIMGWALIMEYAIGNITVAISWSDYFTGLLGSVGVHVPEWMTMDFFTAWNGYNTASALMHSGKSFEALDAGLQSTFKAWTGAPAVGAFHLVLDVPALLIIIFITWLVYRGIRESKLSANLMVAIKIAVVLLVIAVGVFYVDTDNFSNFFPNGIGGVLKGVSAVFFAYIGFDAISTTAEECENPQRDLPRGMMWAIIICTLLYIAIALVLTGMVKYNELGVGDPLAFVFQKVNLGWMAGIVSVSAVIAMASVLLVFQLGQPRIWMSMSRDGLLPKKFAHIHPRYRTPAFATIVTGFVVAVPSLFMNLTMVTDLCSIGTLFAFVLVCAGVLRLQHLPGAPQGKFKTPYINSRYLLPLLLVAGAAALWHWNAEGVMKFVTNAPRTFDATEFISGLSKDEIDRVKKTLGESAGDDVEAYLSSMPQQEYETLLASLPLPEGKKQESGLSLFRHKIPTWIFLIVTLWLTVEAFRKRHSLIPLLGLICCLYMMSELGYTNWMGFGIWLVVGLAVYFTYGIRHSRLATAKK